jgi:hypothetical protein
MEKYLPCKHESLGRFWACPLNFGSVAQLDSSDSLLSCRSLVRIQSESQHKNNAMEITLKEGQDIFFTSDTHINHKNICRGVTSWTGDLNRTRDFDSLESMNSTIINNINNRVGQDDILVFLGDFSFGGNQHIPEFCQRIICPVYPRRLYRK